MRSRLDGAADRAYELALFLVGEPGSAVEIAAAALGKLDTALAAQRRRRRYLPQRRRTRISSDDLHLLERLVLIEAEPFERQQERGPQGASERDLLVRFVAYLVRIVWKRNAFHATVGIARLLHRYGTSEALDLYALIAQDADLIKDESYARACKGRLMDELIARFGDRLETVREARGEVRFRTAPATAERLATIGEALARLTPWDTGCPVPARFDPRGEPLAALQFAAAHPDGEHPVETRRFHALLHPPCLASLTRALGLPAPAERLAPPAFAAPVRKDDGGDGDRRAAERRLSADELARIAARLAAGERGRHSSRAGAIAIEVDGREVARLDSARAERRTVGLAEGAERIELRAVDSGALVGLRLVAGPGAPRVGEAMRVHLPRGGAIDLTVRERGDRSFELALESIPARRPLASALAGLRGLGSRRSPSLWAAVGAALLALAVSLPWLAHERMAGEPALPPAGGSAESGRQPGQRSDPLPSDPKPSDPKPSIQIPSQPKPSRPRPSTRPTEPDRPALPGPTRSGEPGLARVALSDVRAITLDRLAADPALAPLRQALAAALVADGFSVVGIERADAALEIDLEGGRSGRGVAVRLIDPAGEVLWRATSATAPPEPAAPTAPAQPADTARALAAALKRAVAAAPAASRR